MNGLELARGYYNDCAKPLIEERFPAYAGRIAAGLVGEGSECFGFDAEVSTDHDFGPRCFLWLTADDEQVIGRGLQELYDSLPLTYGGVTLVPSRETRIRSGVREIKSFFESLLRNELPVSVYDWLRIPDQNLAAATNGEIFTDPLGDFSMIREILKNCPEEVRLRKLSGRLFEMGQAGQYNYPRAVMRQDPVTQHLALDRFISSALMTVIALNYRYAPFYKWLYRAALECPVLHTTVEKIRGLAACASEDASEQIESICVDVKEELHRQGLTSSPDDFMVAQSEEIAANIERV